MIKIIKHDPWPKDIDFLKKKKGCPTVRSGNPWILAFFSSKANDRPKNKLAANQSVNAVAGGY